MIGEGFHVRANEEREREEQRGCSAKGHMRKVVAGRDDVRGSDAVLKARVSRKRFGFNTT